MTEERAVLIGVSAYIDDCSSYELEVDEPTLEVANVIGRIVYNDDVVAVTADNVLNSLLVACSDIGVCDESVAVEWLLMLVAGVVGNVVSDIIVENVDGFVELLTVVTDWTDEVSKIDVIVVEVWSETDCDVVLSMIVICVDDDTEGRNKVSVELVTPCIVVVPTSVTKRVLVWGNNSVLILSEVIVEIDSIFELWLGVAVLIVAPVEMAIILLVLIECSIADGILLVSANVDGVAISTFVVNSTDDCRALWELCVWTGRIVDVTNVRVLSVSIEDWMFDDTVLVGMNIDVWSLFIVVVDRDDCVYEVSNGKVVVDSCVIDFEYRVDSTIDTFVVLYVSVSADDVAVSMDVAYECAIVDKDKYSPALDVSSTLRNVVSLLVLEIPFVVEMNPVVDSSDSIDEVWSLCEPNRVVSVDVSENISAVVDVSDDVDRVEYSVEVESCSLVVVKVLINNSVDSELVLDTPGV